MMRFKTGLCLKLFVLVGLLLFTVILVKDKDVDSKDMQTEIQDRIKNLSKAGSSEIAEADARAGQDTGEALELQLADASDSLAGNRIDGLPNITEPRKEAYFNDKHFDSHSWTILENISEENLRQKIQNENLFGPIKNTTVVIAVQVHDRITYMRHLINSFSTAKGIENTLLIFSHDVWDENINYLVRSIDFCMTLQIFYPLSLQTHKQKFPGKSHNDCPRDIKKERALETACNNAMWPDTHGHYREAQFTQTKHHWWWKANWIFGRVSATKYFTGLVLFLEEDHYVAEDFLHVLKILEAEKLKAKYKSDILSLGTYLRRTTNIKDNGRRSARYARDRRNYPPNFAFRQILWQPSFLSSIMGAYKQAEVAEWISSKHNMGMAFTRREWNKILSCREQFCKFDDYNWDWSLQHISHHCLQDKLQVIMAKGPRVFHIGDCGVHHKKSNCDSNAGLDKVKAIIKSAQKYLFPSSLQFTIVGLRKKMKEKKPNGGWGDQRDHQLCMNFTMAGYTLR